MRIISGRFRGRRIDANLPPGVRPTTDGAKETIFNILFNFISLEDTLIADICAGTGNLGFEALSRGARKCVFVDKTRRSCDYIGTVAKQLSLERNEFEIISSDAVKFFKEFNDLESRKFDVIFMDPPYKDLLVNPIAANILKNEYLNEGGIIVAECSIGDGIALIQGYKLVQEKKFGSTKVLFIQREIISLSD